MPPKCSQFLPHKNRKCQNNRVGRSNYCHLHVRQVRQSGGGSIQDRISQSEMMSRAARSADTNSAEIYSSYGGDIDVNYSDPNMIGSMPIPENTTSAPNYQRMGDYICVKRQFLNDLQSILKQLSPN
jgi:hypothetical protein